MKINLLFFIFVCFFCSPLLAKKTNPSIPLKVTKNKLFLRTSVDNIHVYCEKGKKDDEVFLYILIETKEAIHMLLPRTFWDYWYCIERKNEILNVLKKQKMIEVFGIIGFSDKYEMEGTSDNDEGKKHPSLKGRHFYQWHYEMIRNDSGKCAEYFQGTCKNPMRLEKMVVD